MTKNNLKIVKSNKNQEIENKEKKKALEAAFRQIDEKFLFTLFDFFTFILH